MKKRLLHENATIQSAKEIETELLALRGEMLRIKYPGKEYLVSSLSPWEKVSPSIPIKAISNEGISLIPPLNGYDHAAFLITNLSAMPRQYSISQTDKSTDMPDVFLYQIPFIKSASMEYVADPLVPLNGKISLCPGESRMFYLSAFGEKLGSWRSSVKIVCEGSVDTLPIVIHVPSLGLPKNFALNSVSWNYLDFNLTRDRKAEVMKDLFAHHSKVVVLYPAQLALAESAGNLDFLKMNRAFELQKKADTVLLFMNYRDERLRTAGGKYVFLSDRWKEWFRKWYGRVIKTASNAGIQHEKIYLYPYDEMGGEEIDQFIAFATWAREVIPGIRFYATLGKKNSEKALQYLDIAQVANNDDILKNFSLKGAKLWLYSADGPSKALSPYSYYRLMAWKAFLKGYKGIGFWAYADTGWGDAPSSAWDDFDGKYPDFAVIYEGDGNTIISSRRWEAWRMGIEDYELLTMYAKHKSDKAAKALAKTVYEHPEDTTKADEVRRKILFELSRVSN